MKYSILGFSQEKVLAVSKVVTTKKGEKTLKLDIADLAILKWIGDLYARKSSQRMVIGDNIFVWVKYSVLIADMPILDLQIRALQLRLEKLVELGLLLHHHEKVNGSFSYYALTSDYDKLAYNSEEDAKQNSEGTKNFSQGGTKKIAEQKTSNNNRLFNEETTINSSKENEPMDLSKSAKSTKKPKLQYSEFVYMSEDEYGKLVAELGESGAKECIDILNNYKGANGKKYKSDYLAIKSWVIDKYREKHKITLPQSTIRPKKTIWEEAGLTEEQYLNL